MLLLIVVLGIYPDLCSSVTDGAVDATSRQAASREAIGG